jgi:hypothetical protein
VLVNEEASMRSLQLTKLNFQTPLKIMQFINGF